MLLGSMGLINLPMHRKSNRGFKIGDISKIYNFAMPIIKEMFAKSRVPMGDVLVLNVTKKLWSH